MFYSCGVSRLLFLELVLLMVLLLLLVFRVVVLLDCMWIVLSFILFMYVLLLISCGGVSGVTVGADVVVCWCRGGRVVVNGRAVVECSVVYDAVVIVVLCYRCCYRCHLGCYYCWCCEHWGWR